MGDLEARVVSLQKQLKERTKELSIRNADCVDLQKENGALRSELAGEFLI